MPNPLYGDEPGTQKELADWLKNNGWQIISTAPANTQGIDVLAKKADIRWGIEVKGAHTQRSKFEEAIGQLLLKMGGGIADRYSIAFPNYTQKSLDYWAMVPAIFKSTLKVSMLLVDPSAVVQEVP